VAAVINKVETRSMYFAAARWFGMKIKNVLNAREPAAMSAKPLSTAARSLAHSVRIGRVII
jgi:hypothetical protein